MWLKPCGSPLRASYLRRGPRRRKRPAFGRSAAHAGASGQSLALISLVVRDYDEALAYYRDTLGFELIEDTLIPEEEKRWVVVAPPGSAGARLLLARAANARQSEHVGDQTGGRVFLFLHTDDFERDYAAYRARGVQFVREPRREAYGTVAVFEDLYGNLWDLIEPA
jgi:catechol 2,3-dioxygenase-like lactoylglutathione lyase family enzyme